jgi:hypothetical protein
MDFLIYSMLNGHGLGDFLSKNLAVSLRNRKTYLTHEGQVFSLKENKQEPTESLFLHRLAIPEFRVYADLKT